LVDAHTHLDACGAKDGDDVRAIVDRAAAVGVQAVVTIADDLDSARWVTEAADWDPRVYAAVALHPTRANALTDEAKTVIERIPSADSYLRMLDELMAAEAIPHRGLRLATAPPVEGPSAAALIGVIPAAAPPPHEATVLVRPRSGTRRLVIAGVLIAVGIAIFAAVQALRSSSEPEAEGPLAAPAPDAPARDQEPPQARPETPPHDAEAAPGGDGSGARPAREGSARAPDPAEADPARAREQVKRWLAEGNRALAAGRFDEAAAQFQRALAADGNAHAAQAGLAEVAYNRGDFARAEQSAKRAVALAPRVAAYRMTLAKAYYKLLRYDDAIAQWQKVLELEPSNERAKKGIELAREKRAP